MSSIPATDTLTHREAVTYIDKWLVENKRFTYAPDVGLLLQDNRRTTRNGNLVKYGRIPSFRSRLNRKVYYNRADLKDWLTNQFKPTLEAKRYAEELKAKGAAA